MRLAVLTLLRATGAAQAQAPLVLNDYPTETRADYVFGCMAANGQTREMLSRCSCSLDVIASILPYDDYVTAETVLSLRQGSGERMTLFQTAEVATSAVADLRRAQAEAEIRCF
jgi:ArsR family metal-binding transcriptional regulator